MWCALARKQTQGLPLLTATGLEEKRSRTQVENGCFEEVPTPYLSRGRCLHTSVLHNTHPTACLCSGQRLPPVCKPLWVCYRIDNPDYPWKRVNLDTSRQIPNPQYLSRSVKVMRYFFSRAKLLLASENLPLLQNAACRLLEQSEIRLYKCCPFRAVKEVKYSSPEALPWSKYIN